MSFACLNEIVKKRRVFGKMFIVCINAQGQKHFYYIRHKSGSCLFSPSSNTFVTVVTNKIIGGKAAMAS
jgi:hypothetical protein